MDQTEYTDAFGQYGYVFYSRCGTISMTMCAVFTGFGIIADTKTYTMSGNIHIKEKRKNNIIISTISSFSMDQKYQDFQKTIKKKHSLNFTPRY